MNVAVEEKVWGRVAHVFVDNYMVSVLEVVKGFRCSKHSHRHRHNVFEVISGALKIVCIKPGVDCTKDEYIVLPGKAFFVEPGIVHWFEVIESGVVVEKYYCTDGTQPDVNDIDRIGVGGPIDS